MTVAPAVGAAYVIDTRKEKNMLWTIAIVLLILWALGLITGVTVSGFIHVLLVVALVAVLIRVISGRRIV